MSATATNPAPTVLIAGATGYLGRFLVSEYARRGWQVRALVRRAAELEAQLVRAERRTHEHDYLPRAQRCEKSYLSNTPCVGRQQNYFRVCESLSQLTSRSQNELLRLISSLKL